jgi:dolichol-phosphate mannosyltransferase
MRVIRDALAIAPRPTGGAARALELAVIIPTLNERANVRPLLDLLDAALADIAWEAIFVDDNSSDGTADAVRAIGRVNSRVRVVQRVGRRGLSSAVVEGVLASSAPVLAVMDADLQHDERILPQLFAAVAHDSYDLAVGSRYVAGGGMGEFAADRVAKSKLATRLAKPILKTPLTDPMSGFFVISRPAFMAALPKLSSIGFKILTDLVASAPGPMRAKEVAFTFRTRQHGESKLDSAVAWEYLMLLLDKMVGHVIPVRFLLFAIVGGLGLAVHLSTLGLLNSAIGLKFVIANTVAVITAMTFNFVVNNVLTYRDRRLKGWKLLRGLLSFYLVCSVGALANVGIGNYVFKMHWMWWVAGVAGAVVGAVWNFAASSIFTWRKG